MIGNVPCRQFRVVVQLYKRFRFRHLEVFHDVVTGYPAIGAQQEIYEPHTGLVLVCKAHRSSLGTSVKDQGRTEQDQGLKRLEGLGYGPNARYTRPKRSGPARRW
jgi:hypothetical protein